eukprot:scaffold22274_cov145-Isochrysis_galbana.AAC.2
MGGTFTPGRPIAPRSRQPGLLQHSPDHGHRYYFSPDPNLGSRFHARCFTRASKKRRPHHLRTYIWALPAFQTEWKDEAAGARGQASTGGWAGAPSAAAWCIG